MNEKRNFKEEVKELWNEYKRPIKAGVICLGIGIFYGFLKGVNTITNSSLYMSQLLPESDTDEDDFVYDETNVDDPELLDLIRLENEKSQIV